MIRPNLLLILPVLAVGACAPASGYEPGPPTSRDHGADLPLYARIHDGGGRLYVSVNEPAHIAIFEIVPGRGVGMVYPAGEFQEGRLVHGSAWIDPSFRQSSRWFHNVGSPFFHAYAGPTRYYLLVASRRPLHTSRFLNSPGTLRTALGLHYASYHESDVLDRLVTHVLPPQPEADWSTDILAVWPRNYDQPNFQRYVRVICPDGSVIVVPPALAAYACGRRDDDAPPPVRPDSSEDRGVTRPGGRRPQPGERTPIPGEVGGAEKEPASGNQRPEVGRRILPPTEGAEPVTTGRKRPNAEQPGTEPARQERPRTEPARPAAERPRVERTQPAERPRVERTQQPSAERSRPSAPAPAAPAPVRASPRSSGSGGATSPR